MHKKVRKDPKRFARKIAKDINLSATSVRRVIKNDLKLLPYRMIKRQYLTPVQKQKIIDRTKVLLKYLSLAGQSNTSFFLNKNASQLKLLLTIRMTECT